MAAPLHARLASGFRWRLPSAAAERDVVRSWVDGGAQVVALANAYDSAFSTCWLDGSRLLLDRFEEAWAAGSGPVVDRLHAAFARARAAFTAQAPALVGGDDLGVDAPPAATLHAVALDGEAAHAMWIGGDVALVSRGFHAVARTTPHTMTEQLEAEGLGPPPPHLAGILTRMIRADRDADPPSVASFALAAGDTLVVASRHRPPTGELAVAASGTLSPVALAEWIVAAGQQRPFAAAAVVRVEGTDLAATVERLVDAYRPDPNHEAWLGDWARAQRALPVWFDVSGVLGLRGDGSVARVTWEQPGRTRDEVDPAWHRVVLAAATRQPALAALLVRPPDAPACRQHGGARCPTCLGLGWELPDLPAWLSPPGPRAG